MNILTFDNELSGSGARSIMIGTREDLLCVEIKKVVRKSVVGHYET